MTTKKAESKKAPETVEQKTPTTSAKTSRRKAKAPEAPEEQEETPAPAKAKAKKAPKIEEPAPPTYEELVKLDTVSPSPEQMQKIREICGHGQFPFRAMLPVKGENIRGEGRDTLAIEDFNDDQLGNFHSIQQGGVYDPMEVLISVRPEHISLLSEGARNDLKDTYGFEFAGLVFSGNFRWNCVGKALEMGGYMGQEDPNHVTLPYITFEDTPINRVNRSHDSNMVDAMSPFARNNYITRLAEALAIENNLRDDKGNPDPEQVSNADLSRAANRSAALIGRYRTTSSLGKTYSEMLTNENGGGFLTEDAVVKIKQLGEKALKEELGREPKADELKSRQKADMNRVARIVQGMTSEELKTLRTGKKNNALTTVESVAAAGYASTLTQKQQEAAGKRFAEIARIVAEVASNTPAAPTESGESGESSGESGAASGGGLSGLKGKEESGTTARKVRPSSQQWGVFLNFLNEQGAITTEQVEVLKFGFQKINNNEPVEGVLAEIVLHPDMSKVLGDITETETESAKAGYVLPVNDNDIKTLKGWNPEIFG